MTSFWFAVSLMLLLGACASHAPLEVVSKVDVTRYMGIWYEIAKYPNRFQKGCDGATAEYSLRHDGDVTVINRCVGTDGKSRQAEGKAWVSDKTTNAKLKVRFFWPFTGDYWIIDLGADYEFAVVSEPTRKYLWILARSRELPKETLDGLLARLKEKGFDLAPLQWSKHP